MPEHPHSAELEDGVAVLPALVERGISPADITTIGDSAAENLAVADRLSRLVSPGAARPTGELAMTAARNVADALTDHVMFAVESTDRMY